MRQKANLGVKTLFGKGTHLLDPEVRNLLLNGFVWERSMFDSDPSLICHWNLN